MNSEEIKRAQRSMKANNKNLAYEILNNEIIKGDIHAMYELSSYMLKEDCENTEFAINLMKKSSELGNNFATIYLAFMYREENDCKSLEYFKKLYYNGRFEFIIDVYKLALYNEDICDEYMEMYEDLLTKKDTIDIYLLANIDDEIRPLKKMENIPATMSNNDICTLCDEKLFFTHKNVMILTCGHMFHERCIDYQRMKCPHELNYLS